MADSELCSKCQRTTIAGCDGRGYMRVDDMVVQPCPNIYRRQLAQHLGSEIVGAPTISGSPLLKLNPGGGPPLVDLTQNNLLIEGCSWNGLLAHLKFVLAFKGLKHRHKVITDERIKNVFVGAESYKSRAQGLRDEVETYNSIPDLVGANYDLLIIKVGYLGYTNKAAAGALKEALLHRESIGCATWLVHDPERGWTHSYDPDVAQYVDDKFMEITLAPVEGYNPSPSGASLGIVVDTEEPPSEVSAFEVEEEAQPPTPPTPPPRRVRAPAPPEEDATEERSDSPELDGFSMPGDNQPERRRNNNWRRR